MFTYTFGNWDRGLLAASQIKENVMKAANIFSIFGVKCWHEVPNMLWIDGRNFPSFLPRVTSGNNNPLDAFIQP